MEFYKEQVIRTMALYYSVTIQYNLKGDVEMQGVTIKMDASNIKCEYLNGAYSELANLLGIEAVLKIHSSYRGQQVTFPVQLFSKEFLKKQIVDEYNGYNIKQLATKYGYSEKWIRKILKEHIDNEENS